MPDKAAERGVTHLGDLAYNNSPFVGVIPQIFPEARLFVIFRDGRDFVRSAYTSEVPDPAPVGWLDAGRSQTRTERYVEVGRLRPKDSEQPDAEWQRMTPLERNAWLWATTNRLILDGLDAWPAAQVKRIRFEEFFAAPLEGYQELRAFLGIEAPLAPGFEELFARRINARRAPVLGKPADWSAEQREAFDRHAWPLMEELGYA